MAQTPPFRQSYSGSTSRSVFQRPWLIATAALAVLAFYSAGGHYSFFRPVTLNQTAPLSQTSAAILESGALVDSGIVSHSGLVVDGYAAGQSAGSPLAQTAGAPATSQSTLPLAQRWAEAGVVIVTEGQEWDDLSLSNIDEALSLLPPRVLANLGNPELGPLHILVNTQGRSLSGSQPYGGPANYYSTNDGINELVLYPGQRVTTVLHELGHAYNLRSTPAGRYAQVLVHPEMESFLSATQWRVLTPRESVAVAVDHTQVAFEYEGGFIWPEVSHFDPLEDFANAFALYYADPEGLRAASPERYGWMAANLPQ